MQKCGKGYTATKKPSRSAIHSIARDTRRFYPLNAENLFVFDHLSERRLRRREARHRHAIRGARHVIESNHIAELDGTRVTAVFAADADFQIFARLASVPYRH